MYNYPYYQPQTFPLPPGQTNIIWVENEEEARIRTRQLLPNSTMIMLDNNQAVAYRCITDISGKPHPVEVFDLIPKTQDTAPAEEPEDVKEDVKEDPHQMDFNEYMSQYEQRIKELEQKISNMSGEEKPRKRGPRNESV